MLRTRLWMGAVLIALVVGVLAADSRFAPWYPFLLLLTLTLSILGCFELTHLLPLRQRFTLILCYGGIFCLLLSNWLPALLPHITWTPWECIATVFAAALLATFIAEMATFAGPGESVTRIALTIWIIAYLGVLPCFLIRLRWFEPLRATGALALTIFVPKSCDIGAYFTGRILGKHRMTPVLSPKKTWEGAVGGLVTAVLVTFGIDYLWPVVSGGTVAVVALGLSLGIAGILGDLAESLIKRDCQQKDASQIMPGFGGVLDVVDAILFAAPVAYWWLR